MRRFLATFVIAYTAANIGSVKGASLDEWNLLFGSHRYEALASGNGKVVAIGSGQITSWSFDQPTNHISVSAFGASEIAYGEGFFVVVTVNALLSSTNGVDWASHPIENGLNTEVVYGNGVFLVTRIGSFMESDDGFNWRPGTPPTTRIIERLWFYGNRFHLWEDKGPNFFSEDGRNWTQAPPGTVILSEVAYGNGKYVALGLQNRVLTSVDGTNWTTNGVLRIPRSTLPWPRIAFGNGYFMAVGALGRAYSSDGVSWTEVPSDVACYDVTFANGSFYLATANGLYRTPPVVGLSIRRAGDVMAHGISGKNYRIESVDELVNGVVNWGSQHTFVMPVSQPYVWSDARARGSERYYRVVEAE